MYSTKKIYESYQSKLTPEDIQERLKEYIEIQPDELFELSAGTHLRYFIIDEDTGDLSFRLGGMLTRIGSNKQYVRLSNGKNEWSVQVNSTRFFRRMTFEEMQDKILDPYKEEIIELKKQIIKMEKHIEKLEKEKKDKEKKEKKEREKKEREKKEKEKKEKEKKEKEKKINRKTTQK